MSADLDASYNASESSSKLLRRQKVLVIGKPMLTISGLTYRGFYAVFRIFMINQSASPILSSDAKINNFEFFMY